ncbi:MAG: C4-dicarboxylate transporter permease [Rhodospirillales bacterium]|nr:C4-dicarboxylate transporter permease [Rhodospirillales bacterium]
MADVADSAVDSEALKKAEEFVAQEEGVVNRFTGWTGYAITALAIAMSLFHLYAAYSIVPAQVLRPVHVAFTLVLCFLLFPIARRFRDRIQLWDIGLAALGIYVIWYMVSGGDDLMDRNTLPTDRDTIVGLIFIALVLEATRRSTGWIMPFIAVCFIAYAIWGPYLPPPWTHRGYEFGRLVGHLFMTLEGIFGSAVDVSSSLIILFTVFGAVLHFTGAGKFFIDFSFSAMGGKPTSAGRAIVMSSFLLGGPSGSGVATTVTLGSVAYPMLKKAGYGANDAGGLLAAGGMGAILSPPVLGAAAFLIAEFLKISYLDVIWMAIIPTCLYYFSLFVMVELDAAKFGISAVTLEKRDSLWALTRRYGFHFTSLITIVVFMLMGFSPVLSVFWATVFAGVVSFIRPETALWPKKLLSALESGSVSVLGVAATCAAAGIIVGVVTLTGLGLKFSSIAIAYAGGSLLLTAIYTALIVWVVGLAVPVTASYIICAVIAAPALIQLGVPNYAAHMFIFYYAVLSEVSPPTALSPFAAAAITGGDPYVTTLQSWKYTLPAFVVPFVFVMDPMGIGLLMKMPKDGSIVDIVYITVTTGIGIFALGAAAQSWLMGRIDIVSRTALVIGGLLMVFSTLMEAIYTLITPWQLKYTDALGIVFIAAAVAMQWRKRKVAAT